MLSLLQRVNILQLIGVKDMDKNKREGLKSPSLFYIYFVQFINIYLNNIYGGTIMEYFDSKVLESFMIPEDSIAIEGFGSKIIEIGKKVINFLITMVTKFISILGNLINKFKHGKTVHNDKETYQENKRLVDATYNDIHDLLIYIPNEISLLTSSAYVISPSSINTGIRNNTPDGDKDLQDRFYDKTMNRYESSFSIIDKKYKNVASKLNGKTIYLDEYRHNNTIKSMEDAKSTLTKTNEELKKALDRHLKDGIKDSTKEVIAESQKRYAIVMKYASQYNTLFNNLIQLITQCLSHDIVTNEDQYKFYDN